MTSRADQAVRLVVPCFMESARIGAFLPELCERMDGLGDIRVVVIEDGSPPDEQKKMAALIGDWRARYRCLEPLLQLPDNLGKGGAVYAGWDACVDAEWLAFVDADGSCSADEVRRLIMLARSQSDPPMALFASRIKMLGHTVTRLLKRHLLGRVYATIASELLRIPVYDSQCGLKFVPAAAYSQIKPLLSTRGFAFDVQLLAALLDSGHSVIETPIDWHEVPGGKIRLIRDSLRMLRDVFAIQRARHSTQWLNLTTAIRNDLPRAASPNV